jgi:hypothetical protein
MEGIWGQAHVKSQEENRDVARLIAKKPLIGF